ncbi:PP2C family protein-serine/threonine phosphatase [Streptomyces sp. NPDC008238]
MSGTKQFEDRSQDAALVWHAVGAGALMGVATVCAVVLSCPRVRVAFPVTASVVVLAHGWLRWRDHRRAKAAREASEVVRGVLLRPLPARVGGLLLASVYRPCGGRELVGGDLYAVARTAGATRLIIGDVRGRGLSSFLDVAAVLGAFREWAPRTASLTELSLRLEESYLRHLADTGDGAASETDERFVTVLMVEVPDGDTVARMVNYGHPPPVRVRPDDVRLLPGVPCPPLGLGPLCDAEAHECTFLFGPHDTLLLYTDGLIEARDCAGVCFPLLEHALTWMSKGRFAGGEGRLYGILGDILDDVVAHCGVLPADDLAMIALARRQEEGSGAIPRQPAGQDQSGDTSPARPVRPDRSPPGPG